MQTGETVTATCSIGWMEQEGGWITYKSYTFDNTALTDNTFKVKVEEPGTFEFRMFKDYFGTVKVAATEVNVVFGPSSIVVCDVDWQNDG